MLESSLESRAREVLRDFEKNALVSRKKRVAMVITAIVERMEPRRVPSRRSMGTLRYMSRLAIKARPLMVENTMFVYLEVRVVAARDPSKVKWR